VRWEGKPLDGTSKVRTCALGRLRIAVTAHRLPPTPLCLINGHCTLSTRPVWFPDSQLRRAHASCTATLRGRYAARCSCTAASRMRTGQDSLVAQAYQFASPRPQAHKRTITQAKTPARDAHICRVTADSVHKTTRISGTSGNTPPERDRRPNVECRPCGNCAAMSAGQPTVNCKGFVHAQSLSESNRGRQTDKTLCLKLR